MGQTLTNCTNMIQQQAPSDVRSLLGELNKGVRALIAQLPNEQQQKAVGDLELAVKAATATPPILDWRSVSFKGLLDAARFVKELTGEIAGTVGKLGKVLFP